MLFTPFLFMRSAVVRHPSFEVAFAALAVLQIVAVILNLLPIPPLDGFGIIEPFFTDPKRPSRRAHPAVLPLVLLVFLYPGGPATSIWRAAYRVGYAAGVPHGAASGGIQLARFWTEAPNLGALTAPSLRAPNDATAPSITQPAPLSPGIATIQVTPGVNDLGDSGEPLFELRGTGSRTSPPLTFATAALIGGVLNDGAVKVWIVPEGQRPNATTHLYYSNGAGDGGASAKLAGPGRYVVIVQAAQPGAHWTVDIAAQPTVH